MEGTGKGGALEGWSQWVRSQWGRRAARGPRLGGDERPVQRCPYNRGMTSRVALFPGTFDPPTLGHVDVVRRAARLFDRVVVAVAAHHDKRHLLGLDERLACVRSAVADLPGVEVLALEGLLVEGARRLGACAVVRGVRTAADLEYERQMALTNRALHPELETVLVLPSPEVSHISSTLVRQVAQMGAPLDAFLTPEVERIVRAALNR